MTTQNKTSLGTKVLFVATISLITAGMSAILFTPQKTPEQIAQEAKETQAREEAENVAFWEKYHNDKFPYQCEQQIKNSLKDPSSFQMHGFAGDFVSGSKPVIDYVADVIATNSFGGKVRNQWVVQFDIKSESCTITGYQAN